MAPADPLPSLCRTCGTEHDGEHATDCARCAEINAEWQAALAPPDGQAAVRG